MVIDSRGAAIATTIIGCLVLTVSLIYIIKIFGIFIDITWLIRIFFASFIIYKMTIWIDVDAIIIPLWYIFLFGIYLCILMFTKEFNRNDMRILINIMDDLDKKIRKYISI